MAEIQPLAWRFAGWPRAGAAAVLLLLASGLRAADLNVALAANGATIQADSEYTGSPDDTGGHALAGKLIDGIVRGQTDPPGFNRWHSALSRPHPHWAWIRFARPARIHRVVLHRADIGSPVDFAGQMLTADGRRLVTLFARKGVAFGAEHTAEVIDFDPVVTGNFRLLITRSSNPDFPQYTQASELQVFGEWAGDAPAEGEKSQPERRRGEMLDAPLPAGMKVETTADTVTYTSPWLRIGFRLDRPSIAFLALDAFGQGKLDRNLLKGRGGDLVGGTWEAAVGSSEAPFTISRRGHALSYKGIRLGALETVDWRFTVLPRGLKLAIDRKVADTHLSTDSSPLRLLFDAAVTPPSPMGRLARRGAMAFPVLLHFPDHGTLLVRAGGVAPSWAYTARRGEREVELDLQAGSRVDAANAVTWQEAGRYQTRLDFTMHEVYPEKARVDAEPKLAGLRRGWLNHLQFRPDMGCFSNNAVSDTVQFCFYEYADQAYFTPPLFDDFTALDLVRTTLDSVFDGVQPLYGSDTSIFMDSDPAVVIAAWDYVAGRHDGKWLGRRIKFIEKSADHILAMDQDGDGLSESVRDGNSGSGGNGAGQWSSNWWDVISFGWKDAYCIALDYRAFRCMADLERRLGNRVKSAKYHQAAERIKALYWSVFYNPATGILAGWQSKDGELHDYWFLWVNGIAISYGLVTPEQGNAIVDRLQAKIKEVGYTNFRIGLPGNLVPVKRCDYAANGVLGQPHLDDGSDSFQSYENGGATGSFAYFYLQALYTLGRTQEADAIFDAMLEGYRDGVFQNGVGTGVDWKRWDGTPCGYEGLLTDTYYALSAYLTGKLGRGVPMP
ncbi:MAG: hypothetical protein HYU66_13835 [Armatimonadetes bacterium]|nr:hypothetical protein [Armatimonadota bacterium]